MGYHPLDAEFHPGNANLGMGHVPFRVVTREERCDIGKGAKDPSCGTPGDALGAGRSRHEEESETVREHLIRNPREESGRGD
jgi:hypothetical protein